jgi:hypothetical protein
MRSAPALALVAALAQQPAPELSKRLTHPSGVFWFMAPDGWTERAVAGRADLFEAAGDGQIVRFVYAAGDVGYDSLHVTCMLERLAPEPEASPHLRYEYDFLSGVAGDYRFLDSAFEITYDAPIGGEREWRQRNVTLVGKGHSLCVILHAPLKLWKKSKPARALQEALLRSVMLP